MAAIIEPRRHHASTAPRPAPRPALRLVTTDGRTVPVPVGSAPFDSLGMRAGVSSLGLTAGHLAAAVAGLVLAIVLSIAISTGALAGLAPAPAGTTSSGPSAPAATGGPAAGTSSVVTVEAGDTYWSIARRLQPTGDVRPVVDQLIELNGTSVLQPGQEITVPA